MAITDKTAIQNYTLTTIAESFDNQLTEWIAGVEQYINKVTDRQIIADVTATDYVYDGNGKDMLLIEDFIAITAVVVDTTNITDNCYFYPVNRLPIRKIETTSVFTKGRQNITLTGQRGYCAAADVPLDLKWAATVLVAGIISHANPAKGEVKSESLGRYSVTYKDDTEWTDYKKAVDTIKSYRRIR